MFTGTVHTIGTGGPGGPRRSVALLIMTLHSRSKVKNLHWPLIFEYTLQRLIHGASFVINTRELAPEDLVPTELEL